MRPNDESCLSIIKSTTACLISRWQLVTSTCISPAALLNLACKLKPADCLRIRVFFPGGTGCPPSGDKNIAHPPNDRCPHFLIRASPPNSFLSPKIPKILPHFALNFDYFLVQNCIRKLYFMLKTQKHKNLL